MKGEVNRQFGLNCGIPLTWRLLLVTKTDTAHFVYKFVPLERKI
jgi:hypothetical protein